MLPYRDSRITKIVLVVFFIVVIGYAYFEARGMLFGPRIQVTSSVSEVSEPFIVIKGRADRIATLTMNGKAISVTEQGDFEEPYLLAEGVNRIIFDAADKYGRSRQQIVQIVYVPTASSTPLSAPDTSQNSSSTATSTETASTSDEIAP